MNDSLDPFRVIAGLAPGWRCERCRKYLPEVGLQPEYPDLCRRCVVVVADQNACALEETDIHVLASRRFDHFFREELSAGSDKTKAVLRAGRRNAGYTADGSMPAWRERSGS